MTSTFASRARATRVASILVACAVLGCVDLALTVWQMGTCGLLEANPVARFVASAGPIALIAFKLGVIAFHASSVLALRARPMAEGVAWVSLALLAWPCGQWHAYLSSMSGVPEAYWSGQMESDPRLVRWRLDGEHAMRSLVVAELGGTCR
ncbi:MAG: DUF5658 family protein [Phycisphaerales bacterium]